MSLFLQRLNTIAEKFCLTVHANNDEPGHIIVGADAIVVGADGYRLANVCVADGGVSIFTTSFIPSSGIGMGRISMQEQNLLTSSLGSPDLESKLHDLMQQLSIKDMTHQLMSYEE